MENLKGLLINLENAGIKTREYYLIEDDIKASYIPYVTLINNDKFKVEYQMHSKEIKFETTYSNQSITDEFIAQMMEIQEMLPLIQQAMDIVYQDKSA